MKISLGALIFLAGFSAFANVEVLQIGDSHTVGNFGKVLFDTINASGFTVRSIGLSGASGTQYSSDKSTERTMSYGCVDRKTDLMDKSKKNVSCTVEKLSSLLNQEKPKILIVELGDNFANYVELHTFRNKGKITKRPTVKVEDANASFVAQVGKVLDQINEAQFKPAECFWIGPNWTDVEDQGPYFKTNSRVRVVSDLIYEKTNGKCFFVNSTKLMNASEARTGSDHLHYNGDAGALWAKRSYELIKQNSKLLKASPLAVPPGFPKPY